MRVQHLRLPFPLVIINTAIFMIKCRRGHSRSERDARSLVITRKILESFPAPLPTISDYLFPLRSSHSGWFSGASVLFPFVNSVPPPVMRGWRNDALRPWSSDARHVIVWRGDVRSIEVDLFRS